MRTTVTLESDVEAAVRRLMRERGLTFKEAINLTLRRALSASGTAARTETHRLGAPKIDVTRALRVADELEDVSISQKLELRK